MTTTLEIPSLTGPEGLAKTQARARWQRLDTAQILKRLFFCERALVVASAAYVPNIASLDIKTELPRLNWLGAMAANDLRERVYELRYPSRLLEIGTDGPLIQIFDQLRGAASTSDFLQALLLLSQFMHSAYRDYLAVADRLADGPTIRFMEQLRREKAEQIALIEQWIETVGSIANSAYLQNLRAALHAQNSVFEPPIEGHPLESFPIVTPDVPARDERFWPCRFYWPDIVDRDFPYGTGVALQMRSAVSHLNEVWAVETGSVMLAAFADDLPFEWIAEAARWTYDEARHCRMGFDRLTHWGFPLSELPLGTYIYDSAAGQDPIYRIGMLFFFETKNIKNKPRRAESFAELGDATSQHDMEFDWADETMHAGYGKKWLTEILKTRGLDPEAYHAIRERCGELVAATIESATPAEIAAIKERAASLLARARGEREKSE